MFDLDQLIKVFFTALIQTLIVVYMNFKNIRRDKTRNILLFVALFAISYLANGIIDLAGIQFFFMLTADAVAIKFIYGLNILESLALIIISLFILIVGDSAILVLLFNLLKFDLTKLGNTFFIIIGNLIILLITVIIVITRQVLRGKQRKPDISIKFFFLICFVFIVIVCTLNLSFNKQAIYTDPSTIILFNLIAFAVYFMVCLFLILSYFASSKQSLLLEQQTREYEQLIEYTGIIEGLYEDIRNQKHDFLNVLFSIKGYVDTGRMDELKDYYYNSVLKAYQESPVNQVLSSLNYIKQTGLKGILSYKLNQAIGLGIKVYINIFSDVAIHGMDLMDLCKVVGILMDNAIEASAESRSKELHFGIDPEEDTQSLIIANTFLEKPNLDRLFQRGSSTKGKNRGLGLYNVKKILSAYPSVSLQSSVDHDLFFQELVFPNKR